MKISNKINKSIAILVGSIVTSPAFAIGAKVESLAKDTVLNTANVGSAGTVITLIGLGLIVWKAVESFFGEWKGNIKPLIGGVLIALIGMQFSTIVTTVTGVSLTAATTT